jgi:hypothetical protein
MALFAGLLLFLLIVVYIERTLILSTVRQELRNIEADAQHWSATDAAAVRRVSARLKEIL